jgi:hypothetical protein
MRDEDDLSQLRKGSCGYHSLRARKVSLGSDVHVPTIR